MTSTGEAFEETEHLLSLDEPDKALKVLQRLGVCAGNESILRIEKAGEGNMNLVMRVTTDRQSVIVKQARPWVEKYPSISAPVERIVAETDFYEKVSAMPGLARMMPAVIAEDSVMSLLVLQDLGKTSDYSSLYSVTESNERDPVFLQATNWLVQLHQCRFETDANVGCDSLREINHAHMFSIPMSDPPAIELDSVCSGLEKASQALRIDEQLRTAIDRLGEIYLNPDKSGRVLLHGDYYPGSWLNTDHGFRVIDPEFCFSGPPEFDLGVMSAHYVFCHAPPERASVEEIAQEYIKLCAHDVSMPLVLGFAGVEIIRRLLGVAQLPLEADLETRQRWLLLGKELVAEFASRF